MQNAQVNEKVASNSAFNQLNPELSDANLDKDQNAQTGKSQKKR